MMFVIPGTPRTALQILAKAADGSTGALLALHGHDEAALMQLVRRGFVRVFVEKRGRGKTWWPVKRYRITEAGREHHAKQPNETAIKRSKRSRS
jgi:DNA-binding PadR family transcriptional regulator